MLTPCTQTLGDKLFHVQYCSLSRLVCLPADIGDLQQLKELHVRNNKLRYFPASIEQLQLYTFTGILYIIA